MGCVIEEGGVCYGVCVATGGSGVRYIHFHATTTLCCAKACGGNVEAIVAIINIAFQEGQTTHAILSYVWQNLATNFTHGNKWRFFLYFLMFMQNIILMMKPQYYKNIYVNYF